MNETVKHEFTLEGLIDATREHLISLNYAKDSLRHMNNCWSVLRSFAESESTTHFTMEFGQRFLLEKYQIGPHDNLRGSYRRALRRSIAMLNEYQQHGIIYKRQQTKLHVWPEEYHEICESFLETVVRKRYASTTQRQYRVILERFITYLMKNEIRSVDMITPSIIDGYLATYNGYKKCTIAYACYILKVFFRYLLSENHIKDDLVLWLPAVKYDHRRNLPSFFTKDEIERLLKAIDRCSPQGKRDYAILLLAVRYGLRVGEITSLQLSDLDFTARKITYTQGKTGARICVGMLETVGWALIDYLKNARAETDCPNVFVRMIAPYNAFGENNNLASIMQKYLTRAGIKQNSDRHYGMHTIRHSLASHLLAQGKPLHVISDALEHLEPNSTMIYTKIDLPQLGMCSLEVPYDTE